MNIERLYCVIVKVESFQRWGPNRMDVFDGIVWIIVFDKVDHFAVCSPSSFMNHRKSQSLENRSIHEETSLVSVPLYSNRIFMDQVDGFFADAYAFPHTLPPPTCLLIAWVHMMTVVVLC